MLLCRTEFILTCVLWELGSGPDDRVAPEWAAKNGTPDGTRGQSWDEHESECSREPGSWAGMGGNFWNLAGV